ncbi:MAG: histidine--tRNA ligase [Flammeovirgaceae bacterium]|nr:histidine--tRNA ligase [Flammeovirgaceae bacterium]
MKKITPTLPKGTRDFGPGEMKKREYLFKIFKDTFSLYGFNALETPSMENINVLNGKYGEEGDKLIFRILDSGDFIKDIDNIESKDSNNLRKEISKKGLRYDLTVPFARYVSMNRDKITLPFKRYQIQNVWRADRPQKGRFREFYQCDVDYIGTKSIVCEAEIIDLVYSIFEKLKIQDFSVKLNNRKVLFGIVETLSLQDNFDKICIIIDKIDKIGKDKFVEELKYIDLSKSQIEKLNSVLFFDGSNDDKIKFLKDFLFKSSTGLEGINEIENLTKLSKEFIFDINLARGLSYYTSSIFEVILDEKNIGSLCGGGRYDDLTEIFGYKDISGIGISFGIERIYEIMKERNLFPDSISKKDTVLVCSMSEKYLDDSLRISSILRNNNISTDLYPDNPKLKKQLQYANKNDIPYVIIIGEDEVTSKLFTLKDMETGSQEKLGIDEIISKVSS